jgi:hypothetical protein
MSGPSSKELVLNDRLVLMALPELSLSSSVCSSGSSRAHLRDGTERPERSTTRQNFTGPICVREITINELFATSVRTAMSARFHDLKCLAVRDGQNFNGPIYSR